MKIAICDGDRASHKVIQKLLEQYRQETSDFTFQLSSFYSGQELLNYVDEYGGFDLYILDCIMPDMDGIELGRALRRRSETAMLFYLTSSPDFALESYRVNAFDYLLKPVDESLFIQGIDKAFTLYCKKMVASVTIKAADSVRLVAVTDILYAERDGKRIYFHMTDGTTIPTITFNGPFKEALTNLLSYEEMLLVGSSFAVNLSHVTEVTKTELILDETTRIPIPRRLYESVRTSWTAYWEV